MHKNLSWSLMGFCVILVSRYHLRNAFIVSFTLYRKVAKWRKQLGRRSSFEGTEFESQLDHTFSPNRSRLFRVNDHTFEI